MSVDLALRALIARSGNDVAVLLAEAIGANLSRIELYSDHCHMDRRVRIPGRIGEGGPGAVENEARIRTGHVDPPTPRFGYGSPRLEAEARQRRRCRYHAFIDRMNETARRLGMRSTHFENASGLPDRHQVTTARDMALLVTALYRDFPEHAWLYGLPSVTIRGRERANYNALIRTFDGADGMKTGFTCASGYNLIATATRNGTRLAAIVMGHTSSRSRNSRAAELLEFGLMVHGWHRVAPSPRRIDYPRQSTPQTAPPGNMSSRIRVCVYGR